MHDLSRLFRPASIAVVGASERPGSYSSQTLVNLEAIGFPGRVYGVNPKRTQAHGRPCFPSVSELPEPVDALVVAIPAALQLPHPFLQPLPPRLHPMRVVRLGDPHRPMPEQRRHILDRDPARE